MTTAANSLDDEIRGLATRAVIDYLDAGTGTLAVHEREDCAHLPEGFRRMVLERARDILDGLAAALRDDQLLRDCIGPTGHEYLSTACGHASETTTDPLLAALLHDRCCKECKWCLEPCLCACHQAVPA